MTFRDVLALSAAALLTGAGAAHAQPLPVGPSTDRVVVDITNKPMPRVRAELLHAAEAVCASGDALDGPTPECVDATFHHALSQVPATRASLAARPAEVASR